MPKKNDELEVSKFTKEQIVNSKRFNHRVDLLKVILKEETLYTLEEVENEIEKFMKGKVN